MNTNAQPVTRLTTGWGDRTGHRPPCRFRGVATVELALCLPVLMLVVFGAVEGANVVFLKQSMVQSAYEGAKVAVQGDPTNEDVINATRTALVSRLFDQVTVEMIPADIQTASRGDLITIRVSAPSSANSLISIGPFGNKTITGTAVMVKE